MKIVILLIVLTLYFCPVSSKTVEFAEKDVKYDWQRLAQQLNHVDELLISDSDLSEESFVKVLSHEMPKLTKLGFMAQNKDIDFYDNLTNSLTPKIIRTIFLSKYFSQLKQLDLSQTNANDNWFQFLENQTLNSSLEVLKLKQLRLGKKGYARLAKINFNGLLKHLQLEKTLLIENETVESLLKIICEVDEKKTCNNNIQALLLQNTQITRDGFIKLIQNVNSTTLKELKLNSAFLHYNKSYKEGFNYTAYQVLSKISFPNLQLLQLQECGINDEIMHILSEWKLPKIVRLFIMANPITDEGFKAMVKKENIPNLAYLSIHGTQIKEEAFKHLRQQNFQLKSLNIGKTKISERGWSELKKTDLKTLERLVITGVYLKPQQFYTFLKEINCENLTQLSITEMNDLSDFLKQFPWKKFEKLQTFHIIDVDIADGYTYLAEQKSVLLPNLKKLSLVGTQIDFQTTQAIIVVIPTLFPQVNRLFFTQKSFIYPISLRKLFTLPFPEGTLFNFYYLKVKKAKKLEVISLIMYAYLLWDDTNDKSLEEITKIQDYFVQVLDRVSFEKMKVTSFADNSQIALFSFLNQITKITQFPNVQSMSMEPQMNAETFFNFFSQKTFPNLRKVSLKLTIPGDVEQSFINSKINPLFTSFHKLERLSVSLTFLNEENGSSQRKKLLDLLQYPFISQLLMPDQEMNLQEISQFIKKHSNTLKSLNLDGNFLEEDFFQLMAANQVVLQKLSLSKISFTAEEFKSFGKMHTEFLTQLQLSQNDLSNEHFKLMIQTKNHGPYFPKLQNLILEENSIQRQGLESWLETQMFNLEIIICEKNYNPSFLNTILQYPTKVHLLVAFSVEVYSLDKDLNPNSVQKVSLLDVKADGFTVEDFKILGNLNFNQLQESVLYLNNIYDCEVLINLLKINTEATSIGNSFKNDKMGLNSKCLQKVKHSSNMIRIFIQDQYGTTYLPEYIELLTNSTRDISYLILVRTMLSPQSLKKILSKKLHSINHLNLQHNYLDDQTFKVFLNNDVNHLYYLNLKSTMITSQSLAALALKAPSVLAYLNAGQNQLDIAAIQAIRTISQNLQQIHLNGCNLQGDSLRLIKDSIFPSLAKLYLDYNQFTQDDIFDFLTELQKKNFPSLSQISLKGISLNIPKHKTIQNIMKNKGFSSYQLDRPYNIPQSNAATI